MFPSNNTAGNWIGACTRAGAANESFTVVDSKGNVYRKAIQYSETNDGNSFGIYYAENIAGGANAIRVSGTATATLRVAILEYSGVATSGSLDVISAAQGHNATPNRRGKRQYDSERRPLVGNHYDGQLGKIHCGQRLCHSGERASRAANEVARGKSDTATAGVATASARLGSTDFGAAGVAAFKPATQSGE